MPVRDSNALPMAALLFLAANLLHTADHVRQHFEGLNAVVMTGGALVTAQAVAVVVLARQRHRLASITAVAVGFVSAVLVAQSHLLPHWSVLSDSYLDDVHPDLVSWAIAILEVVAALALGAVGLGRHRAQSPTQVSAHA
ncbi:MAG: hypothetical protein QOE05_2758 [Actinomycetota bacterium]|nr:hypothetical protein [Actinomycetota bacterium]